MKPNHHRQAFFLFLFSLSLWGISTEVMNNNNNPDSPDSPKENSFQGFRPPPPTNVAGNNGTHPPPPTNVSGDNETRPPPLTNVPGSTNETHPRPPINVPGANETHERPKKRRAKEIVVGGDPIMTTLRLGCDPNMQSGASSSKAKGKKPEPIGPKITCPCNECGKSFWSWKALFGHMRCHPERGWRGINPPANLQRNGSAAVHQGLGFRGVNMTDDDHDVATGLLMLANGLLSMDATQFLNDHQGSPEAVDSVVGERSAANENYGYMCSSCKRVFGSHQALGGHRASHKNVKGCFAIAAGNDDDGNNEDQNNEDDSNGNGSNERGKSKETGKGKMKMVLGHRCGICSKVFSSGQALGGHMRCHWERGESSSSSSVMLQQQGQGRMFNPAAGCSTSHARGGRDGGYVLDLNFPPPPAPAPEPEPAPAPEPALVADDDENPSSSSSSSSEMDLDLKLGF